jgi:hypothetical protein
MVTRCANKKSLKTHVIKISARVSAHAPHFLWSPSPYFLEDLMEIGTQSAIQPKTLRTLTQRGGTSLKFLTSFLV